MPSAADLINADQQIRLASYSPNEAEFDIGRPPDAIDRSLVDLGLFETKYIKLSDGSGHYWQGFITQLGRQMATLVGWRIPPRGTTTDVRTFPPCDWRCGRAASHNFKTTSGHWVSGCDKHYRDNRAYKDLGTGKGQRFVLRGTPAKAPR